MLLLQEVYIIAGFIGMGNADVYTDLKIWGVLFLVFGVYFIYSGIKQRKVEKKMSEKHS